MSDHRERKTYFREYRRQRYAQQVAEQGREVDHSKGRPRMYGVTKHPLAKLVDEPGWPTRAQLMAGR